MANDKRRRKPRPSDPTDSTAQPERPESPRASEARLAGILDIADDAIIAIDSRQRITLFNQGAERIFGYTTSEVLGQPLDLLLPARFGAIHRRRVEEFADSGITARRMGERRDIYGRHKDGREFPAEASISKLDLAGEMTFTVILRDITTRKRFEQELQEKNAALEQAILAKDRFLASMSHELRTPLNAIIGFTGTLLMRLPGPLTDDQERQLQIVQSSGRHLLSLINDLLDLAKIESGRVELSREPVVCQDVIAEVAGALRPLAEQKGLRLDVDTPARKLVVQTDRRALSQIVINLVNNAIKFTLHGDVRIALVRRSDSGRALAEIAVIDTGVGIRTEEQAQLFEVFARGKDTARSSEGSGLGLHLSQRLAELLGGRITFASEYGKGSTFTLALPEG